MNIDVFSTEALGEGDDEWHDSGILTELTEQLSLAMEVGRTLNFKALHTHNFL